MQKPVDQAAASRAPYGRDALWPVIRTTLGEWTTVSALFAETWMDRRTIRSYLACLVAAGIMERRDPEGQPPEYRLLRDPGRDAPRLRRDGTPSTQGAGTENMWRTMRMLAEFSPRDVAAHATTDAVAVSEATAKAYCKALFAAGYLRVVRKAVPKRSQAVYRLIRNTGPRAPQVQRAKRVFDRNTQEVFGAGFAS